MNTHEAALKTYEAPKKHKAKKAREKEVMLDDYKINKILDFKCRVR